MIELPEAVVLAAQMDSALKGRRIQGVVAAYSPHKFAWYFGEPREYSGLLMEKTIAGATSCGGQVEVCAGDVRMLFTDGVNLRCLPKGVTRPDRHQLLLEFDDGSGLVGSVQMYGGVLAFREGAYDNRYYLVAKEKPSPLSDSFDVAWFNSLLDDEAEKLSLKAFLATEQRIPGLGNGVLQDILFNAGMHPKKKVTSLSESDRTRLFGAVKTTLSDMVAAGGRDTENDLWGRPGGYATKLSRNTVGHPCAVCGMPIRKEAYMGGSVYFCVACQQM